ncbi:MAG: 4-alpha-glucanotransferase [Candidatus Hydrogenedentes bacterium]|nr:4-alpha-glucanotransferase [Candidatus Hydrogenedentota bacterium]
MRSSGVLLHPTSFPSQFGIGDLGDNAYRFVEWLERAGQRVWQVLPLGPTGYGDSPYQSFSTFAGNWLLISPERLVADGVLAQSSIDDAPAFPAGKVDFGWVIDWKRKLLKSAADNFFANEAHSDHPAYEQFCRENDWWLSDYTFFMAVKEAQGGLPWNQWEEGVAKRYGLSLHEWGTRLAEPIRTLKFAQYQFFKQWFALKEFANARGVRIIGDIPIYVAHDSADVWAHQELYQLDDAGNSTVVAGVPPDYFSATGQLWGNPIYRWELHAERGFDWWIDRIRATLRMVDWIRIDHFRGFEAYWEVPGTEKTAVNGRWVKGPCDALFEAVRHALGEVPVVAENLGVITDEVEALRKRHGFPGMAVLQFAFGKDAAHSGLLPHKWEHDTVAYTGTADNDTTIGWWKAEGGSTQDRKAIKAERAYAKQYLDTTGKDIHWVCIRAVMASVADTAIFPLQDVIGLDTDARMNLPGSFGGHNWTWRYMEDQLTDESADRLRGLAEIFGRCLSADDAD